MLAYSSPVIPPSITLNVVALRFREKKKPDQTSFGQSPHCRGFPSWRLCRWVSLYINKQQFSNNTSNNFSTHSSDRSRQRPVSLSVLIWKQEVCSLIRTHICLLCTLTLSQSDSLTKLCSVTSVTIYNA